MQGSHSTLTDNDIHATQPPTDVDAQKGEDSGYVEHTHAAEPANLADEDVEHAHVMKHTDVEHDDNLADVEVEHADVAEQLAEILNDLLEPAVFPHVVVVESLCAKHANLADADMEHAVEHPNVVDHVHEKMHAVLEHGDDVHADVVQLVHEKMQPVDAQDDEVEHVHEKMHDVNAKHFSRVSILGGPR